MPNLDRIDLSLLRMVMQDARIPHKDIGEKLGISRASVHWRMQRLIDQGVIIGSGYKIDYKKLGYKTFTYIGIILERGSLYDAVRKRIEQISEVTECHYTTGPYSMLIKLFARDNDHLMEILRSKIQAIDGVVSTETMISLEESINRPFLMGLDAPLLEMEQ